MIELLFFSQFFIVWKSCFYASILRIYSEYKRNQNHPSAVSVSPFLHFAYLNVFMTHNLYDLERYYIFLSDFSMQLSIRHDILFSLLACLSLTGPISKPGYAPNTWSSIAMIALYRRHCCKIVCTMVTFDV